MNSLHCCASVLEVVGLIRALIGLLPAVPGVAQELEHLARDGVPEGAIELSAAVPGVAQASSQPAPVASSTDPGIIAYVRRSTYDIHVVSPDGSDDRVLWTAPQPLTVWPAFDLAWRPDGRELAFSSQHEEACSWYQSDVYAIGYDGAGYRRVTNAPACAELAALPKGSVTVNVLCFTIGSLILREGA